MRLEVAGRERTVAGYRSARKCIGSVSTGAYVVVEMLITHRFGIRDAAAALHAVEKGVAIKAVIDPLLQK
jgi:hypothetical protein